MPKGRLVKGPYTPICRDCAIYLYPGVTNPGIFHPFSFHKKALQDYSLQTWVNRLSVDLLDQRPFSCWTCSILPHKKHATHEQTMSSKHFFLLLWKKSALLALVASWCATSCTLWCPRTPFACRNDDVMAELDLMKDLNEGRSWSHGKCDGSHDSWHKFASWGGGQCTSYLK